MYCILTGHAGIDTEGKRDLRQHSSMTFKLMPRGFNGYKFYIFCKPVLKYRTETKKKRNMETIKKLFPVLTVASETKEMELCFLTTLFPKELPKWILGRVIDSSVILSTICDVAGIFTSLGHQRFSFSSLVMSWFKHLQMTFQVISILRAMGLLEVHGFKQFYL